MSTECDNASDNKSTSNNMLVSEWWLNPFVRKRSAESQAPRSSALSISTCSASIPSIHLSASSKEVVSFERETALPNVDS